MIKQNYLTIKESLPKDVLLVVVSKGQNVEEMLKCYEAGARDFGENRLSEFLEKKEKLPKDIKWHMIGTIQSKKVPKMIGQFELIHSIDSVELLEKFEAKGVKTNVLLESNTSGEPSKHGLSPQKWLDAIDRLERLKHVSIQGLMTMAPLTDDESLIRKSFNNLLNLRDNLNKRITSCTQLSMGMSQDWKIAIEEGATIVRIGSSIFKN